MLLVPGGERLVARRRPAAEPAAPDPTRCTIGAHRALRASACVEVWAPDRFELAAEFGAEAFETWRAQHCRFRGARDVWKMIAAPRLEPGQVLPPWATLRGVPWSYQWLAETNPERLAETLAALELPPNWEPTFTAPRALWDLHPRRELPESTRRLLFDV